jgi:hypothetical protein
MSVEWKDYSELKIVWNEVVVTFFMILRISLDELSKTIKTSKIACSRPKFQPRVFEMLIKSNLFGINS